MRHMRLFEDFTKQQVKDMLLKAQKNSKIDTNLNIDDLLTGLKDQSEKTAFEKFVESEAKFISEGDYQRMEEYIEEFKKLKLDVSKLEQLYPKLKRYKEIENNDFYYGYYVDYKKKDKKRKISELNDEIDKLQPLVNQFIKEVKVMAKKAKELL